MLEQYADAQTMNQFHLHLDIGRDADASRLAIGDILLELQGRDELGKKTSKRVPLPGANGPNPELSSGPRSLGIISDGSFVGLEGKQFVDLGGDRSRWEMVWRENAPAGALICAFDVPEEIRRNEASLPKGNMYITFPVWTKSGLKQGRDYKIEVEKRAAEYEEEKQREIEKIKSTNNLLLKAVHYRKAYAAADKYYTSGISRMNEIPNDDDIINIGNDLLLCKSGTVWTKTLGFGGSDRVLLGVAEAKVPDEPFM